MPCPHSPPPMSQPLRSPETSTCSPTGQYELGRKCSSTELNQCQPPATGWLMAMCRRDSTAC